MEHLPRLKLLERRVQVRLDASVLLLDDHNLQMQPRSKEVPVRSTKRTPRIDGPTEQMQASKGSANKGTSNLVLDGG